MTRFWQPYLFARRMCAVFVAGVAFSALQNAGAQAVSVLPKGYNYDEARVAPYTMLDPLRFADGKPVTRGDWPRRRAEIVALFEKNVYGKVPEDALKVPVRAHLDEEDDHALGGLAVREQVTLDLTADGKNGPQEHLLLYLPARVRGRVPVILGLNFNGNQAVADDAGILLNPVWSHPVPRGEMPRLVVPDAATRGHEASEWQVKMILARGYGLATVYYGDIEPDFKGPDFKEREKLGIRARFAPATWGALSAWAWGLSRAMDYLETNRRVDARHVAVMGHSRLGKAGDWAAALDTRFAAVLSNESGKAGESLLRRSFGENTEHLWRSFPYWFGPGFAQWVGHDQEIPADGNLLLALLAPRPVCVGSAAGDLFSDPRGEFLSAKSASRVYALLGRPGLDVDAMPGVNQGTDPKRFVAYHIRSGGHDVTAFDWTQYLDFLDAHFGRREGTKR